MHVGSKSLTAGSSVVDRGGHWIPLFNGRQACKMTDKSYRLVNKGKHYAHDRYAKLAFGVNLMLTNRAHIDTQTTTKGSENMINNAQTASALLNALLNIVEAEVAKHDNGITNIQLAKTLEIESEHSLGHKNYFSWVLLQTLTKNGRLNRSTDARPRYTVS
jgi:hypothetical protein